jgi:transposase
MGRLGSTTSVRARQMRRVLAGWQRSGLTLREFGEKRGIPLSTLTWWRRVFRDARAEHGNGAAAESPVVFVEVPKPASVRTTPAVLEIVLPSGHLVRVPAGADTDTLQRVLQVLQTTC